MILVLQAPYLNVTHLIRSLLGLIQMGMEIEAP